MSEEPVVPTNCLAAPVSPLHLKQHCHRVHQLVAASAVACWPVVPPHFLIAPARASAAWPMIVTLERIVLTGPCYFAHSLPCVCMFTVCSGAER
jgi:hypothetical protein